MSDFERKKVGPILVGDQPLPRSHEAERAVLSCVLTDPINTLDLALGALSVEGAFCHPAHRQIFAALRELRQTGDPAAVDLVTLADQLDRQGILDDVGGDEYLTELLNVVPTTANIERYIESVRHSHILRNMIAVCTDVVGRCYECDGDVPGLVDQVEAEIMRVAELRDDQDAQSLEQLLPDAIKFLDDLHNRRASSIGIPTGFDLDDKITGLKPGEMTVLAARPSIGKTALALNIARNVSVQQKVGVGFFSLEMSSLQVVVRMLSSEARANLKDIRDGRLSNPEWAEIVEAEARLRTAPLYIIDTPQLSSLEIRQKARRLKQEYDIGLVIIDYLQLIRAAGGNASTTREQEVARQSAEIKALAKELEIPVVVLCQLNRQAEQGGRPKLSQLRESGAIEQDADVVLLLHRARETEQADDDADIDVSAGIEAELIVAKNRNGETGEDASRMSEDDVSRLRP
jgi:replicative DNA helicase